MKTITRHITQAASIITILIGVLIVGSWVFANQDIPTIRPVKFNTGLCILLSGIALFILDRERISGVAKNIAAGCCIIVLLIASLTIAQYIFAVNTGIDQFFWKEKSPPAGNLYPGRMASLTASVLLLLSISLLLLRKRKFHLLIHIILIAGFGLLSLIFLFFITSKARFSIFVPASLHTSFTLLLLYVGTFFSSPLRYLRFSFSKRVGAFFLYTVLLLLIVFLLEQRNIRRFKETAQLVENTNTALLQNLEIKSLAQQIETSARGFVISGKDEFLFTFDSSVSRVQLAIQKLRTTTRNNPDQHLRIDSLDQLVNQNITVRQQMMEIRRTEGFAGAEEFFSSGVTKKSMNALLLLVSKIDKDEKELLAKNKTDNESSIAGSARIILLFQILTGLLLLGAFLVIYANTRFRNKAEKEIKGLNENLERKVQEKTLELLKNELHFSNILDNLLEGAQIIGFDWKYKYINDAYLEHSRYSRSELLGFTVMEKFPGIEKLPIYKIYQKCFRERVAVHLENEFEFPDGSVGWFELSFQPVPEGIFILSVDITPRKKSEFLLKELNETLEKRANELQISNTELEQFAYVASHDLQEPLRMVSSFVQLLEKRLEGQLDETGRQYIHFAIDGAARMKKLIQDLLEYSRVGTSKDSITDVDCNEVMLTVRSLLSLSVSELKATLVFKKLPVIRAIPSQMIQLFQNLVGNAIKYHGADPLIVEVGCVEKGRFWEFYVKDNGIGIEPKFFDKIFVIFQRLHNKSAYAGTGIGLSICKKIVEKHGGTIHVASTPGIGTTFYFTLPRK